MLDIFFRLFSLLPFYLLGAFPSGKIVAKLRGIEITEHGSGNVGATNVSRVLGKRSGLTTLLLDVGKGLLAISIAGWLGLDQETKALVAVATVAGHCFSVPGKLPGGKGVATSLGVLLALSPGTASFSLLVFIVIFWICRIVSVASVGAALLAPIIAFLSETPDVLALAIATNSILVIYRHKANLTRLVEGREGKFL